MSSLDFSVLKNRKNRFFNFERLYRSHMLSKRLEILHVYEKGLQSCFDLKSGAISSACPEIYLKNRQKGVMSVFSKNVFVVTKILRIWTMGVITFHTHILMSLVKFSGNGNFKIKIGFPGFSDEIARFLPSPSCLDCS